MGSKGTLLKGALYVAGGALLVMMGLAFGNMALRPFSSPIKGTYELVGFMGSLVASLALGYTQSQRGHTLVDILSSRYPARFGKVVQGLSDLLLGLLFVAITYELLRWARELMREGELSETLRVPFYPFVFGVAVGCGLLTFVFLSDALKALGKKG